MGTVLEGEAASLRDEITSLRAQLSRLQKTCDHIEGKRIEACEEARDLRRQLEEARAGLDELRRYTDTPMAIRYEMLREALKQNADLRAENERLREALEWLRARPCIHANLREGFGVGCSFCRADAALQGIEWHSMMEGVRVPPDRPRAALDKGDT